MDKKVFRAYDIRGIYKEEIDEDFAYTLGRSFGTYISNLGKNKCIVGHDNRLSSPSLYKRLTDGILSTGIDVVGLNLATTPMVYYASIYLQIESYIQITASHNPKEYNGFKFAFDKRGNARGEMIEDFCNFTLKGNFIDGIGKYSEVNIDDAYINLMKSSVEVGERPLKVVLDLGNGATTCIVDKVFSEFPFDIELLFNENDGAFPNHHPDPCEEKNLEFLKKKVIETKADVGFAFDGDGDRFGIVDEKGNFVPIEKYMILIIRNIINKVSNKKFLYDVKCSKILEDEIEKLGGEPVCYRTGNSYVKAKIKEDNIPFGGELSGHIYFNDRFPGFDSGIYASLRLLEILSKSDVPFSSLLENIDSYEATPDMKFECPDDKKFEVVDKIKAYCISKGYKIFTTDGVRASFPDGWALVRASNTSPNITARFEARSKERLIEIEKEFTDLIKEYINIKRRDNMTESKPQKSKSNAMIWIVLVLFIALVSYGFVSMNNYAGTTKNSKSATEETVTELNLSSSLVYSLADVFSQKYLTDSSYPDYFYKQDKTLIADIPNEMKISMAFDKVATSSSISEEEYKEAYKQIFGSDASAPLVDKVSTCQFNYEYENGYYEEQKTKGCGGAYCGGSFSKLIGAKNIKTEDADKIVITEAVAFSDCPEGEVTKFYKDYEREEFVEYSQFNTSPLEVNYDKYAKYEYTFVKDEKDIYVFTSVERVD